MKYAKYFDEALIAALIAAQVILLFSFRYFPSQDGPEHVYNVSLFLDRILGGPSPLFDAFHVIQKLPSPNLVATVLLGGLMLIFPALIAEKILLGLYVLLLPIATIYALRSIDRKAGWLALLILPFSFNLFFHLGFYNFSYSLIFFFLTLGYWLRRRPRPGWKTGAGLLGFLALTYFSHIATFVVTLFGLAVMECFATFEKPKGARARWLVLAGASLPLLALAAEFVLREHTVAVWTTDLQKTPLFLMQLVGLGSFVSEEVLLAAAVSLLLMGVTLFRWGLFLKFQDARRMIPWLGLFGIYSLLYIVSPAGAGGGAYLQHRLILFPFFALLLAAATQKYSIRFKRSIQGLAAVITVGFLVLHGRSYGALNEIIAEYMSAASLIESQSTILPLTYNQRGNDQFRALNVRALLHIASIVALARESINLLNYEAHTNHFILKFKEDRDPFTFMACGEGLEAEPPCAKIADYERKTGQRIDYVLLWNPKESDLLNPVSAPIVRDLRSRYRLVGKSSPEGLLHVYRRMPPP
ncbi:hypothetical protein HYZ99_04580 [Candidatus Peregrinibacteria bacterium]|nr:hypothetical protein [Candidatus Peregrinibacteria bacterium]